MFRSSIGTLPDRTMQRISSNCPESALQPAAVGIAHLADADLAEPMFYYFAYGSCMCPVDLKRSLGESTHNYVVGTATLRGYRLGFFRRSQRRNCGVLDVIKEQASVVEGVLYRLPQRLSDRLDEREEGYSHETIEVYSQGRRFANVRTYTVIDKLSEEHAPNDWYFNVVLRGAVTCGLPEQYCWNLFHHMQHLQQRDFAQNQVPQFA